MFESHESDIESDISISGTPPEIRSAATSAVSNLIPEKSKRQYEKCYKDFKFWCNSNNVKTVSENVLLVYFVEKSKTLKSSSLWSTYSMLKCMLNIKEDIDVKKFLKLVPYLKKQSVGYTAKKSKVLTQDQIKLFLENADDGKYLLWKVVLVMGVSGAMRRDELTKITIDDINDGHNVLIITVRDTKTGINRSFTITNLDYIRLYRKYVALRPKHVTCRRLFLRYEQGRCYAQVIGVHTIGKIPSLIANYLQLPDSKQYTGHCFRRSSATLLANSGATISVLKRHGGWKSATVAESYIEDSIENKNKIAKSISGISSQHIYNQSENNAPVSNYNSSKNLDFITSGVNVSNNSNCTITININPKDL